MFHLAQHGDGRDAGDSAYVENLHVLQSTCSTKDSPSHLENDVARESIAAGPKRASIDEIPHFVRC
jgi:hypothetical protein